MKKLLTLALATLAAPAFGADDPLGTTNFRSTMFEETCKNFAYVRRDDYNKNKEFWDKAMNECGADVQILPDTGFLSSLVFHIGEQDENRRSALFLKRVGERAKGYVGLNNRITENLVNCAKKNKAWFDEKKAAAKSKEEEELYTYEKCGDLLGKLKETMEEVRPQMRQAIALSGYRELAVSIGGSPAEFGSRENPEKFINSRMMSYPGLSLPRGHEPLTASELAKAKEQFEKDTKEIEEGFDKRLADLKKREDELKVSEGGDMRLVRAKMPQWYYQYDPAKKWTNPTFLQHLSKEREGKHAQYRAKYNELLVKAPILAFLGKDKPTDEEIAKAAGDLLKNGQDELKEIADTLKIVDEKIGGGRNAREREDSDKVRKMFDFMKYGPVVREVLAEDPSQCKTADGIANYIFNSDLRNNIALGVGMLGGIGYMAVRGSALVAGTFLAGLSNTALATAAALPVSAGLYYRDYRNFLDAERRMFNVAETERTGGTLISDMKDYEEAKNALTLSLAIAGTGIDFWGLGLVKGAGIVGSAALAGRGFTRAANSAALRNALKAKGLGADEITRVFADLNSGDATRAGRAAAKLIKDLGLDDAEIRFMRAAAAKGVLKEGNEGMLDPIRTQLAHLDARERKAVYSKALEILDDVNSAKLNDANRRQVLEAAIAGARFGIKDPKQLAAKINDWEEGIEGLTKTFQLAKKHMDDPGIKAIANLEARQEAAFAKALDEMRAANPEMKAMPDAEWELLRPKLLACGIRPRA